MKKKIAALIAFAILISGCSSGGKDVIINADGYEGLLSITDSEVVTPAVIPEITNVNPVITSAVEVSEIEEASSSSEEDLTFDTTTTVFILSEEPATTAETASVTESTTEAMTTTVETTTETETVAPIEWETSATENETSESITSKETETLPPETTGSVSVPVGSNSYQALNYREVKGVWISYIELSSVLMGKTESQFTAAIRQMYGNCVDMGLNTVYVHVRSHGDAYYNSDYYPWSRYVTGTAGQAPTFDPLTIMVNEAHAMGLSFQAWINPYRLNSVSDMPKISSRYLSGEWYSTSNGDRISAVDSYYYLNPGYEEATDLIAAGAKEIVVKYNVDGIHIDDYFYPTTDSSFDSKAFASSGYSSLSRFRTDNCSKMVKALYNAVKSGNSTAVFGVAPQGNIQNNYNMMYADVKTWCSQYGYIDYIAPQIYFGFKNSVQPFETVLADWQSMVSGTNVKLISGLGVYRLGSEDGYGGSDGRYEWINDTEIIKRQIQASESKSNYSGFILYSYNYVFNPPSSVSAINAEMKAVKDYILV